MQARLKTYLDFVRFEHTIFALPFAYAGMFFAAQSQGRWPTWLEFLWITLAMAGARTAAMAANRLIDAGIDAANPRTAKREIPSGKIKPLQATVLTLISLGVLWFAAAQLNPLALKLLPIAVVFLILYPYTKRFTWLCHVWLGITDGAAAAGGWIAITGMWHPGAIALWLVVVFWMVGLDVIYATQDHDFDTQNRVQSIPARFGIPAALKISAWSHFLTFALLVYSGYVIGTSWAFYLAAVVMGGILLYEHRIINPKDLTKVNIAFFDANSWLALTMLVGTVLDVILR
ncbi:menaquinone biosynthesis prenyltransferase MqnP [Deinococcus roseus]|uniref:menaquinone biosynthesis prenyltransferase MqnP n=1 Tax=Deinococcus roseus TaxID=392414 RepID=UPI001E45F1BB|nr:menaquinone biosynthesis prenyltransferase MqnP [Deinococcus roseus]